MSKRSAAEVKPKLNSNNTNRLESTIQVFNFCYSYNSFRLSDVPLQIKNLYRIICDTGFIPES